ncbi:hypothetical protein L218DRAFT_675539 [Marasmius fiardii PR-910]|nr:hypothetical protein L218DRAFT_675539 [Marasmius fiardii PR-910]
MLEETNTADARSTSILLVLGREGKLGSVGNLYIEFLRMSLGCLRNELWVDPTKSRFRCGPAGPKCRDFDGNIGVTVPSDAGFLKKDILIRYFCTLKDDRSFVVALDVSSQATRIKEVPSTNYFRI